MNPYLSAMGIVFLIWVFLMVRMLLALKRKADEKVRQEGGGFGSELKHRFFTFTGFFSDPEVKTERRRLYIVTVLLFAIIVAQPFVLR